MIDGSTIPSGINVNPAFTICMLAERCMRLCAADFSWRISYDISQNVAEQLGTTFNVIFPGFPCKVNIIDGKEHL